MSNKFENRFENFEQTPPEESWSNIQSNISKTKFNWLAFSTIVGGVVLIGLTAVLFLTNNTKKIAQKETASKVINTNTNSNSNNENIDNSLIAETDNELINNSNNVLNNNSEIQPSKNSASTNSILLAPATTKINIPIENSFQLKEVNKISQKDLNTDFISLRNNQTNEDSEADNDFVNELDNKINIEGDTTSIFRLYIPSGFTPSLETNNIFKPAYAPLLSYEMSIVHRNGNLVFCSKDINYGWNGQYKGKYCEQGTYVYIVKFINLKGEQYVQKGTVTLVR